MLLIKQSDSSHIQGLVAAIEVPASHWFPDTRVYFSSPMLFNEFHESFSTTSGTPVYGLSIHLKSANRTSEYWALRMTQHSPNGL
jgi:hypothetical protein